jgi:hypothetical protein|uniref:hypothetical protein n=1 Tax=Prosthecobacter sp. TaxID=1965333 RepID=UPI003782FBA2
MKSLILLILSLLSSLPLLHGADAQEPRRIGKAHQLFLDDHIVANTEHLTRRVQQARKHEANPLFVKEHDWEPEGYVAPSVIYDDDEKIFKAWLDGYGIGVFYFTSKDGIHWERPLMRLFPEFDKEPTNRVILTAAEIDTKIAPPEKLDYLRSREAGWRFFGHASGVIKDQRDPDPQRRYKMAYLWIDRASGKPTWHCTGMGVAFSPDGIHWTPINEPVTRATVDMPFHINYDEQRQRWVLYGRTIGVIAPEKKAAHAADPNLQYNLGRAVIRCESEDFIHWTPEKGDLVLASDAQDSTMTEIYDMRRVAYEGVNIGFVHMYHNDPSVVTLPIQLGISRDNKTWQRLSDRSPFLAMGGLGEWDRGVISPPVADPIVVGDELRFYYTGRNQIHGTRWKFDDEPKLLPPMPSPRGALGLATIKRDRFVAMEASFKPGILRTKPFIHDGVTLHVNAAIKFGALTVSLLDENGVSQQKTTISGRDETDLAIPELTKIAGHKGQPMRLEFAVQNGRLFSFWIQ